MPMLFRDFFPRLQARALTQYGVTLSERQFTNWREKRLIHGPGRPQGRGRGLSPDRHWPIQSYRRALRICRCKSRGLHHFSGWWVLLWLSGEEVSDKTLRASLKRELKSRRRQTGYLSSSGFLASKGPTDFQKIPTSQYRDPLSEVFESLTESPQLGLSAETHRDVLRLAFEEDPEKEVRRTFMTVVKALMGHEIPPEDIGVSLAAVLRPGHLSEVDYDYIGECQDQDLELARQILQAEARLERRLSPVAHAAGATGPASILFALAFGLSGRRIGNPLRIDEALKTVYQITDDRRSGRNPMRRLETIDESHRLMDEDPDFFADPATVQRVWDEIREAL